MTLLEDPIATAGLVTREVRTGARDGVPTRIAVARRTYPTDQADLWDALTNPERLPRWFLPVTGELEPGGRYQTQGNAGGVVESCDAPNQFAVTWEMGPAMSWLTLTLTPEGAGTVLELVHEAQVDPGFAAQFGPGAVGVGWDLSLMALGLHTESGAAVDPAVALPWPTTPAGIDFVRAAADGWSEAAIADGDDPVAARAARDNTIEFYTVEPEGSAEPEDSTES
ncbi:SRPBCC family protein [Nocardia sp. NBC_01503]|uniref:SRPBCC family protein n=1 Tax=Nocardia sp. NBC_01503 TaxID=2975997 RepID=UPI002E7C3C01|nr:SRPBCC family protein [Nocardia sp. NBC_01503]WTL32485.1 SRPBCC family protein [Nocardia sp. NBC_01503]